MYRRLPCDWFLSDGIHKKIRLDAPHVIEDALLEAGIIPRDANFEERQRDEWIFRRSWRYSADFMLTEKAERVFLRLTGLMGHYTLLVNGMPVYEGEKETCEAEITAFAQTENSVEIKFAPAGDAFLRPVTGFGGAAGIKETGSVAVKNLTIDFESGQVSAETDNPGGCTVELKCEKTQTGNKFTVRAEALVDGAVSDDTVMSVCVPSTVPARGLVGSGEEVMGMGAACHANCAFVSDLSMQVKTLAARHSLPVLTTEKGKELIVPAALETGEKLLELAGGEKSLVNPAFWILTGSDREVYDRCAARFDEAEPENVCALSRCLQADEIKKIAVLARVNGTSVYVSHAEKARVSATSDALMDLDGAMRPAFYALSDAWKGDFACTSSPAAVGNDGIFSASVYCVSDEHADEAATVTVSAFELDGTLRNRSNFAVTRGMGQAGRVTARLPENGVLILRTELSANGEPLSVSDEVVFSHKLKMDEIEGTQLLCAGGKVTNVGATAALYVTVPGADYFGCLLPGESVTAVSDTAEGINVYI